MSHDLYFWPSGCARDPERLARQLAEEECGVLQPDDRVLALRAELLRRWPELADMISPWHHDLGWRQPWGRADLADRFVGLTLPLGWEHVTELPALAAAYGLDCFDPQADAMTHSDAGPGLPRPAGREVRGAARPRRAATGVDTTATVVGGWVAEDNVVKLMEHISRQIGYTYDDLDEAALTGALDGTDDEAPDGWFQYPLVGTPTLMVGLARSVGSAVVMVRVEGPVDEVLAARIETLLDLL